MASDTVARESAPVRPGRPAGGRRPEPWLARVPGWLATLFAVIAWVRAMGGEPRVFESNRNFRNEGADATHYPGFTMLEAYEAYGDYRDFPTDVSPLTRQHRHDRRMAERWDLVAFGAEIGTAYSELIDPVEQRARLTAQSVRAAGGDAEAMELDEEFLAALEYAMPPTGGLGMGVDRLLIMLTGRTIRDTVLFPLVRPSS
jgi:lysyl-tRNA synthetase class II